MSPDKKRFHPNSELEAGKVFLPDGINALSSALASSDGTAAVIVHPYYNQQEADFGNLSPKQISEYDKYVKKLSKAVETYKNREIPIVLFDDYDSMTWIDDTLSRMGLTQDRVFLVRTGKSTPYPKDISLDDLSDLLQEVGMRRAVISGSNFWLSWPPEPRPNRQFKVPQIPVDATRYKLRGCVGVAMTNFLESGIQTSVGFATYPAYEDRVQKT